jgi:hypothetical protein
MSLWPSRGLTVSGFEIKVSRGDWKRELEEPEKSAEIQSYCDEWWIVAPRGMLEASELPLTWGLLEVDEKRVCKVAKAAPILEAKPLSRSFVASVLRRSSECEERIMARERAAGRKAGEENGGVEVAARLDRTQQSLRELTQKVEEFERASGIQIRYGWDLGNVGEAVRLLRNHETRDISDKLRGTAAEYRRVADRLILDAEMLAAVNKSEAAE